MALSGSLDFLSTSVTGSNNINIDFVGLRTLIIDPVSGSNNLLGFENTNDPMIHYNNEIDPWGGGQAWTKLEPNSAMNALNGKILTLIDAEGTTVTFTSTTGTAGTDEFKNETNNNTTADNIFTSINTHADFTVPNPAAAILTVFETSPSVT